MGKWGKMDRWDNQKKLEKWASKVEQRQKEMEKYYSHYRTMYALSYEYDGEGMLSVNVVEHGKDTDVKPYSLSSYADLALILEISKGQLCMLAEQTGCVKVHYTICSPHRANVEELLDKLAPWIMASKLRNTDTTSFETIGGVKKIGRRK